MGQFMLKIAHTKTIIVNIIEIMRKPIDGTTLIIITMISTKDVMMVASFYGTGRGRTSPELR